MRGKRICKKKICGILSNIANFFYVINCGYGKLRTRIICWDMIYNENFDLDGSTFRFPRMKLIYL